ncbi:MAG: hypothetical protein Q6L60_02800 [Thermostichus sp. HHBFW_bins_43]
MPFQDLETVGMYISAEDLPPDLRQIMLAIEQAAQVRAGACLELLMLLRLLEEMHRLILDGTFRESLPNTRQALYRVLQDLEEAGDWPYLPRLHIQALMQQLEISPEQGSLPMLVPPTPRLFVEHAPGGECPES